MKTRLVFGALLAAMATMGPTWHADAQSRSNSGGYAPGGAIGGGTYGNRSYGGVIASPRGITRNTPADRAAPVMRPSHSLRPSDPVTSSRPGMGGYYQNNTGNVPPGTRATTVRPR